MPLSRLYFAWDATDDPTVLGYKLYVGRATQTYTSPDSPVSQGNILDTSYLPDTAGFWYFALTVTTVGGESLFSNELVAFVGDAGLARGAPQPIFRLRYR